ncbi:MAG TPA: hypothetical protein VFA03_04285 [Acetobacteraceae bacterium]|nr:hypothetical protein [Acetobacteraceae bacterium]
MRRVLFLVALGLPLGALAPALHAGPINGTITGSTATAPALAVHPQNRDDTDTATTINIQYFNYCSWIVNGIATQYPNYTNLVFAGIGAVGQNFTPIDPSDFTISQYKPWVVNNNATTNFITAPDNGNVNRGVSNRDSGGADIVISYTPGANDPRRINFVQAFVESVNGGAFTTGTIDSSSANLPYYNAARRVGKQTIGPIVGTGTTRQIGTVPLVTSPANGNTAAVPAWMVDIPLRCENGPIPPGGSRGCLQGADDTLTSETQTFQAFIEADATFMGQTYHVLYGGVQWGYTLTMVDPPPVPEPAALLLLPAPLATLLFLRRRAFVARSAAP